MTRTTITVTRDIELSIDEAAEWFSGISDDDMAQFFCKVAEHAKHWPAPSFGPDYMWYLVGQHLAKCSCSTEDGRNMIRYIFESMEHPTL